MASVTLTRTPPALCKTEDVVFEWSCVPADAPVVYRLTPLNDRLYGPTSARRVNYPLLPDGAYTFTIQALDEHGIPSAEVTYNFQVALSVDYAAIEDETALVPITDPVFVRRRSVSTSKDYNAFLAAVKYDLTQFALAQVALRSRVSDALTMWHAEVTDMNNRLRALQAALDTEIDSLIAQHYELSEPHTKPIHPSSILPGVPQEVEAVYSGAASAKVDVTYGTVTLGEASYPQDRLCYRHPVTGKTQPISNLLAYISPVGSGISDGPIARAIDGDLTTAWIRRVQRPVGTVGPEEVVVALDLPLGLTNNPNINTVGLMPFPEGLVDIVSVEYRPFRNPLDSDDGWVLLPSYPFTFNAGTGTNDPVTITGAFASRWSFPEVEAHALRLRLRTSYSLDTPEGPLYIFGIKSLSAMRAAYVQDVCYAHAKLGPISSSLPAAVYRIVSVTPVIANLSCLSQDAQSSSVLFDYYIRQPDGTYAAFDLATNIAGSDELLIVIALRPDPLTRATPVVERVDVTYCRVS